MADDSPSETLSFTFDDGGDQGVLELIKDDGDGNLSYRDNEDWTDIGKDDDLPGFYDKDIIDIAPEHSDEAVKLFDDGGDLNKASVASLLQVKQ